MASAVWVLGSVVITSTSTVEAATVLHSSTRLVDILNENHNDDDKHDHDEKYDDVLEDYITQSLDHFRLEDERQFRQRFFYTDRYVVEKDSGDNNKNKDDTPTNPVREYVFLCVGGEGPALSKAVLVDSVHCTGDMIESARRLYETGDFSIHLFALEHRYYGKSYPNFKDYRRHDDESNDEEYDFSPITNEHLVYLSSRQAQADLAHFVATQNVALGDLPWITFGGSYPGVMAAYARLRFPHYIAAAVSSSAPVQPILDFAGYNNHVARVLNNTRIGGSTACLQTFVDGHADLVQQVKNPDNHARLAAEFGLCNATQLSGPSRNVELWLGDGVTPVGTQENDPACTSDPLCNIGKKCAFLLQARIAGHSPAQALAKLERQRLNFLSQKHNHHHSNTENTRQSCTDLDWEKNVEFLSDTSSPRGGWRSWLWQTCTEFGFYQTCEVGSTCPYGRGYHPLSQDLEICQRAFGVSPHRVASAVQESMQYYGGWQLGTSRVLSVNGDVDPWSELALLHSATGSNNLPAFVVPGASHHFWTHPVKETDSLEVIGARELIYSTIVQWLDDIDDEWAVRRERSPLSV